MGTGIVSVASHSAGFPLFYRALLIVTTFVWFLLVYLFLLKLIRIHREWFAIAKAPGALTMAAATGVLGLNTSLLGWTEVAWALLILTTLLWLVLIPTVLCHWPIPTVGVSFLLSVATESVAVLSGQLATTARSEWALMTCVITVVLGLVLYTVVLTRFDFRELLTGSGDQWVAGGALAISSVATVKLVSALEILHPETPIIPAVRVLTLVLAAFTSGWYVVLTLSECIAPRLHYDLRRWSTVFPLGMTCTAAFVVAAVSGFDWLYALAHVLLWPAVVVFCLSSWGAIRRLPRW